jgi:amino acid adenylation domain-containing protein
MLADQSQTVGRLQLLDSENKNFLLKDCNSTEILPLPAQSIPEMLATSFAAMPSEPAAEFYGLTYSRTRLAEKSDRLASWLVRHGIIPGSLVGIYMDRSLEMLVAMLAVMKAGAAYVPLDPRFPAKRMQQILDETEVPILLTLSRHVEDLPEFGGTLLSLDSKANELAREPLRPLPPIAQQMRAYVIFTSGSTGKPKGVEVTHGAVVNLLVDVQRRIHMGPKDRLLAVTTLAFDISVLELLLPLISGGTVVIATQDDAADGLRLAELLVDSQITVLQATPFAWRMLLDVGFELPPGFKMLCGGEAWTPVMADKLLATGGRLWNMYGPTETTVWSSVTEMQRGEARITIGPPIANTRFYVLDERLEPLPPGVSGELFIAGLGLARGYFKRDDLTIEKFLPDPFVEGQRMYRTGDEVRQLPDGRIEFIGRLDHQVKLRGFRIELGEIEVAIGEHAEISNAVVVKSQDSFGESLLAAYYTARSKVAPSRIQEWLQSRLPTYMVPTVLEQIAAFPLTPNGKIDRNALSRLCENSTPVRQDVRLFEAGGSGSSVQLEMLEIWAKIFEGQEIRSSTDFFDIGGDSLSLVRLQAMVTRQFGVHLTMADITRHSTFGSLTTWVSEMREVAASSPPKRTVNPRVLPVHSTEAGRPIFLLPQMMIFWPLAEELGEHQSLYALQLLDEDISPSMESASFEQLALLYCDLIRQVQPEGPYRLGGWCLWGLMAYEIARLLEEQGDEVELVMIMDAWAPGHWTRRSIVHRILMKSAYRMHRLRWIIGRLRYGSMEKRKQDVLRQVRNFAASSTNLLPESMRTKNPDRESNRIEKLVADAAGKYQPKPIKGTVAVFKGEQQPRGLFIGEDLGWAQLIGRQVFVDTLPGNHSEIFDLPGARIMAARIREVLHS